MACTRSPTSTSAPIPSAISEGLSNEHGLLDAPDDEHAVADTSTSTVPTHPVRFTVLRHRRRRPRSTCTDLHRVRAPDARATTVTAAAPTKVAEGRWRTPGDRSRYAPL